MPLDPHIRRILDMLAAAGAADASRLTLSDRREAFRKLMSISERNVAVGHVEERALPGPDGPISVRIYTPIDFFFQAEDGIRDVAVTGVQTCALPIWPNAAGRPGGSSTRAAGPW